jgi:hypothetical protein
MKTNRHQDRVRRAREFVALVAYRAEQYRLQNEANKQSVKTSKEQK